MSGGGSETDADGEGVGGKVGGEKHIGDGEKGG